MILIGVGTEEDEAVSASVNAIQQASNAFSAEVHDPVRLEITAIAAAIGAEEDKRVLLVSHGNQTALVDASVNRRPYLGSAEIAVLNECYIFAHACSTGAYLGREAVVEAFLYVGFDTTISAPPRPTSACYQDVIGIYRQVITFIRYADYQDAATMAADVQKFLNCVRSSVMVVEARYDVQDGTLLDAEEVICVRQFKDNMCGWVRGIDYMLKSVGAPTSPFLW
jgi:hypothetical protein